MDRSRLVILCYLYWTVLVDSYQVPKCPSPRNHVNVEGFRMAKNYDVGNMNSNMHQIKHVDNITNSHVSRRLLMEIVISAIASCSALDPPSCSYATDMSLHQQEQRADTDDIISSHEWISTSLQLLSAKEAADWKEEIYLFGHWPDPILRRIANPINFDNVRKQDIETIAWKLRNTARAKGAVGLAAQQWYVSIEISGLTHLTD